MSAPVFGVGFATPEKAEAALEKGEIDLAMFARALWADPDMPNKIAEGAPEDIRRCNHCATCDELRMNETPHRRCRVNPAFLFAAMFWYPLLETAQKIAQESGLTYHDAFALAMNDVLDEACRSLAIPKRLTTLTAISGSCSCVCPDVRVNAPGNCWSILSSVLLMTCWPCELKLNVTLNCSVCEMVGGGSRFPRHQIKKGCSTSWMKSRHRVAVLVVHANAHRVVRVPHDSGVYCHRQQSGLSAGAGQCCPESIRRYP